MEPILEKYKKFLIEEFGEGKITEKLYLEFALIFNPSDILEQYKFNTLLPSLGRGNSTQKVLKGLDKIFYGDKNKEKILNTSLDNLGLSVGIKNSLKNAEVEYFGEITSYSESSLSRFKNMGAIRLTELKILAATKGIPLGSTPDYVRPEKTK